jgi:hypothetical protein
VQISWKKIPIAVAFLVSVPLIAVLGHSYLWLPLKYRHIIKRVENAQTADQEKAAFKLAADWGRVWELDRLTSSDAAADGRKLSGDWLLRIEWLDSLPFSGGAYRAYRSVIDTNNLHILWEKRY